jgi:hypothetical protein
LRRNNSRRKRQGRHGAAQGRACEAAFIELNSVNRVLGAVLGTLHLGATGHCVGHALKHERTQQQHMNTNSTHHWME